MKVEFFGHNCFALKSKEIILVTDPWLTKKGAFLGSWFQWPNNHHLKNKLIESLDDAVSTFLYISHEHQDHFDKDTLKEIQPYIDMCFIPKYDDSYLYNEILNLGYKVTELHDQSKHFLNKEDYIELMIVDTGINHDSAAIIHIDNKIFLNQNDCKIYDRLNYLESLTVDFYSVQFSGATWHPVCYQISAKEKKLISKKKILSKFIAVRNAIELIKPKYFIPSAGPAIFPFLDESLSLGIDNIFVHQPDIASFLKNLNVEIIYLLPGESISKKKNTFPIQPPTSADLKRMRLRLNCIYENIDIKELNQEKLLDEIIKRINQIKDINLGDCPKLIFDWKNGGVEIDLTKKNARLIDFTEYKLPQSYMKVVAPKKYFAIMSDSRYRWQDIYLSLRAAVKREPDVFNNFINIFLFSDPSNIRHGFTSTLNINNERIVIMNPFNRKSYEINRYCPHNGADLKNAKIDFNGKLICPRHSWLFDLRNQGKCDSADSSICAKEIKKFISKEI